MSKWRVQNIDASTWLPVTDTVGVKSMSVRKDSNHDGSSPLLQSGDMELTGKISEGYYRISKLEDDMTQTTVATLLLTPDTSDWKYGAWSSSATGSSVLKQASTVYFKPGAYVPQGTDGVAWVAAVLREDIPCPVKAEGSFKLSEHIVFDLGASHLDGIWQVLDVANFTLSINAEGEVTICQKPTIPVLNIGTANRGLLESEITFNRQISDVPNVVRVYVDGREYRASNDDPASPTSTVTRGLVTEILEEDPTMKEGESPIQYAMRKLIEQGEIYETYDVVREYVEGVEPNSLIRVNLPDQDMNGYYTVLSQSITCEGDIRIEETWGRKV